MEVKVVQTKKELDDAFSIRHNVFVIEQQVPSELEIDEFEDAAIHFVLYDDNQPIGAGRCRILGEYIKVERICVLDSKRKTGAGKILMNKIEEIAKEKRIHQLKLNSQTHAEAFYKKIGYTTISDVFMDAGIPHVTMVKEVI